MTDRELKASAGRVAPWYPREYIFAGIEYLLPGSDFPWIDDSFTIEVFGQLDESIGSKLAYEEYRQTFPAWYNFSVNYEVIHRLQPHRILNVHIWDCIIPDCHSYLTLSLNLNFISSSSESADAVALILIKRVFISNGSMEFSFLRKSWKRVKQKLGESKNDEKVTSCSMSTRRGPLELYIEIQATVQYSSSALIWYAHSACLQ
jgi:hypothetical protein